MPAYKPIHCVLSSIGKRCVELSLLNELSLTGLAMLPVAQQRVSADSFSQLSCWESSYAGRRAGLAIFSACGLMVVA